MKDFYYILGTNANCSPGEIKDAYRKLSKKFHPDLNENDAYFENRFKEIQEAYETLSDPSKRGRYDAALKNSSSFTPGDIPKKQPYRSKTKWVDIIFTLVLMTITLIFADYVYKSINGSKAIKSTKTAVVNMPVVHSSSRHKRKHHLKAPTVTPPVADAPKVDVITHNDPKPIVKLNAKPLRVASDTPQLHLARPVPAADNSTRQQNKTADNTANTANYDSYIKANATGVVYMKQLDSYNSAVVDIIPTNSKVFVLEKGNIFYKVSFDNKTGYVPKWTVQTK